MPSTEPSEVMRTADDQNPDPGLDPDLDLDWDDGTGKWHLVILLLAIVVVGLAGLLASTVP